MRCAVYGCRADNSLKDFSRDVKFFSFPKDKDFQAVWKHLCKRADTFNVKYARICSKHFSESDYERNLKHELLGYTPKKYRPLKKEAIPSRNLPGKQDRSASSESRGERLQTRKKKDERKDIVKDVLKG